MTIPQPLLSDHQLAVMLGVSVATVRRWRLTGQGPCHVKLGDGFNGTVRYRHSDIDAWIASRVAGAGEQNPEAA